MTATRALTPVGRLWYRRRTMPPATDDIVAHALAEIRARIDDTDRKLLRLLDQRIEFALRAGRLKAAVGDPAREAEVLDKVASSRGRSSRE